MPTVLGLSCSLRNARFGAGSTRLVDELKDLEDTAALIGYLKDQTAIRLADFEKAGRQDGKPFSEIYDALRKAKGDRGLSNSEAALAAGLWGALQEGCDIVHCGLSRFFPMRGPGRDLDELRELVLGADAFLLSGPVYFGDRGSIAQEFIEFLRSDPQCAAHVRDRLYAGIAVGAKRNGGQETTLIYQMLDMVNLNALAVGNDSKTTSQYGGTAHAGDVGTLYKDEYGINTSVGTGRRLASVAKLLDLAEGARVDDTVTVAVWLLQDSADHRGRDLLERLGQEVSARQPGVKLVVHDFTGDEIARCIACDVCPVEPGPPSQYRCIINTGSDLFVRHHQTLLKADAILIAAYSPTDRSSVNTVYQRFVERTRYLRRDDYVIGDRLAAPLVISDLTSRQNLHVRMMTSMVRHHQVMHHPLIGMEHEGDILNWDSLVEQAVSFAANAGRLTAGRLARPATVTSYNPVGYHISAAKTRHDNETGATAAAEAGRREVHAAQKSRLATTSK